MIVFFNLWVGASLALFYLGPVDWPGARGPGVLAYVALCLFAFNLGALSARGEDARGEAERRPRGLRLAPRSRSAALTLLSSHAVLAFIYLFAVTGKSVLSTDDYSLDVGQVYTDYGMSVAALSLGPLGQILVLAKAVLFPFALVTFMDRFKSDRLAVVLFIAPMAVGSMFRGTDKEIIDMVIFVLVAAYLHGKVHWRTVAAASAMIPVVLGLFVLRRLARFSGDLPTCLPDSVACFNYDSFVSRNIGRWVEVLNVFVANYLTNGYQGLSNAFELRWEPTWGVGHLPPLKSMACNVVNVCMASDYQSNLTASGWDSRVRWTSVYTVIANDLSFWLVPLYLVGLGFAFRRSLAMWRASQDPAAGGTLILITVFWIYSSANMQIAISLDWAFATLLLLYVAPWRRVESAARAPT